MTPTRDNMRGVSFLVLAMLIFSLQDIAVKWIGGDYSVIEIVVFRSIIALPATLVLFRLEGNRGIPTTKRHKLEYVRGVCLFLSFTTYNTSRCQSVRCGAFSSGRKSQPWQPGSVLF